MNESKKFPDAIRKLLSKKKGRKSGSEWVGWFNDPTRKKALLNLVRAGEEKFATSILEANLVDGSLGVRVDRLLPQPEPEFWDDQVTFYGRLAYIESGVEVITEFRCSAGERLFDGEFESLQLKDFDELAIETEEYIARLGKGYGVRLWLYWFGAWKEIDPEYISRSRIFLMQR